MIFDKQVARKPDYYPWAQEFIDSMWTGHWTPNEFNFQSDIQDYKVKLTDQERLIVQNTLSAIGQIEVAVKKFWGRLGDNLPHPSLSDLGFTMANIEVIHGKAYEKLLDVLQLQDVFTSNLQLDIIRGRVNYLTKYLEKNYEDNRQQYVYSLILFTLFVENVSLFSQFYVILWLNRYNNVLKDTSQQILYTKNEELIHALAGMKIVNTIRYEHPELFTTDLTEKVIHEAQEAFAAESKIIDWMLGDYTGENISAAHLKEFVKNRINNSLKEIGFPLAFSEYDPVLLEETSWMDEEIIGGNMIDFFHKKPTDYSKKHTSFNDEDLF